MEVIRKKICLECARSRKQGLLAYIPFGLSDSESETRQCKYVTTDDINGNWGNFPINPYVGDDTFWNYAEYNKKYCRAIEILNAGIKTKRVVKNAFIDENESSLSWSTNNLVSGYCYSINFDYTKQVYEYYIAKESMFNFDDDVLYTPKEKGSIPSDVIDVNILTDDDYEEFLTLDDSSYSMCKKFDEFIGRLYVDSDIEGPEVPVSIDYCDVLTWYNWMNENKDSEDCCIIKKWNEKGGQKMLDFLEENKLIYETSLEKAKEEEWLKFSGDTVDDRCIPTIDINLLLTTDYIAESLAIPYIDDDFDISYSGIPYEYLSEIDDFTADSELMSLRDSAVFLDDDDIELPGVFERFSKTSQGVTFDSAIFYYNDVTEEWEDSSSNVYPESYNVVDIAAAIPDDADHDDAYLVKYDNSSAMPMRIPYSINNPKNVYHVIDDDGNYVSAMTKDGDILYEYVGDFILDIDKGVEGKITFTYVLGGHFYHKMITSGSTIIFEFYSYIEDTGVKYKETFGFNECQSGTYTIDGKEVTVYYDEILYDDNKRIIVNDELGLQREAYLSNIIAMPMHDYFSEQNKDEVTNAPLIRPDYINCINNDIVTSVNVSISRGSAAAFEKHFKLSECNTLEDLVNYGNNFFNL